VSLLGPEAQAAVQPGTMAFFSVYSLLLGLMLCVTTVVSQSLGARRLNDCSVYAWQGVWASLIFGTVALAAWPLIPGFFALFGHAPAVQAMEVEYTRIRLLGLGAAGACLALGNFFNGVQRPGRNTISVIIANVVHIPLSYALVVGAWGFPAMGIGGAAWGSVVATIARLAYLVVAMCFGRATQPFAPRSGLRWDTEKMRRFDPCRLAQRDRAVPRHHGLGALHDLGRRPVRYHRDGGFCDVLALYRTLVHAGTGNWLCRLHAGG
jgi:MATE family multidrug resistance protein